MEADNMKPKRAQSLVLAFCCLPIPDSGPLFSPADCHYHYPDTPMSLLGIIGSTCLRRIFGVTYAIVSIIPLCKLSFMTVTRESTATPLLGVATLPPSLCRAVFTVFPQMVLASLSCVFHLQDILTGTWSSPQRAVRLEHLSPVFPRRNGGLGTSTW